jgi:hypothetical protein
MRGEIRILLGMKIAKNLKSDLPSIPTVTSSFDVKD